MNILFIKIKVFKKCFSKKKFFFYMTTKPPPPSTLTVSDAQQQQWNTYGAKWLIWLAGLIFCIGGTCLLCAHNAGVADFYHNYDKDHSDNTYTLYLDGWYCANGRCISFDNSEQVCPAMHDLILEYQGLVILSGSIQMLFTLLMFGTLFLRMISQIGKELLGAHAAKKSICAKIDDSLKSMSKSRLMVRVSLIGGSILMLGLFIICSYLVWQSQNILYIPMCPGDSTSSFNISLSDHIDFSSGRGTHLVLAGCCCALSVGGSFVIWMFIYVCCNWKNVVASSTAADDDLEDEEDFNPEYREYKEKYEREERAKQLLNDLQKKNNNNKQNNNNNVESNNNERTTTQHFSSAKNQDSSSQVPSILNHNFGNDAVISIPSSAAVPVGANVGTTHSMKAKSQRRKAQQHQPPGASNNEMLSGDSMKTVRGTTTSTASNSNDYSRINSNASPPPNVRRTMTPREEGEQ